MNNVELLLTCMTQSPMDLLKKNNINCHTCIVNQIDYNSFENKIVDGKVIKLINRNERGLSKSRNLALFYADKDIVLLADDDVKYVNDLEQIINQAYIDLPEADVIIFNIHETGRFVGNKDFNKVKKSKKFRNYGSVRISFKLSSINKKNISFDERFGAGSIYNCGEDSIFIQDVKNSGLKVYEFPALIGTVDSSESSWFAGYNEKYFFNIGAVITRAYPKYYWFFKYYYLLRFYKKTELSSTTILKNINNGIKSYKMGYSFEEYQKIRKSLL